MRRLLSSKERAPRASFSNQATADERNLICKLLALIKSEHGVLVKASCLSSMVSARGNALAATAADSSFRLGFQPFQRDFLTAIGAGTITPFVHAFQRSS